MYMYCGLFYILNFLCRTFDHKKYITDNPFKIPDETAAADYTGVTVQC